MKCVRVFTAALLILLIPASNSLAQGLGASSAASRVATAAPTEAAASNRVASLSFKLKPTAIAPAGAEGSAEVKSGAMYLHLNAVAPGQYVVRVFRKSDDGIEKLGTINIIDATLSPSVRATDNKKEASANPEMVAVKTDTTMTLPSGLSDRDIARVQVLAQGGNAVLDSEVK